MLKSSQTRKRPLAGGKKPLAHRKHLAKGKQTVVKKGSNELRIIGGQWRGRKLKFPDGEGLRPTMDRVRETLFNWLQADIADARCLDLFSGSGALGFEALSRSAAQVIMVDKNLQAIKMIRSNMALLKVDNAQAVHMDAAAYLQQKNIGPFDIVFLDPPFNKHLVEKFCQLLHQSNCLSEQAVIYIEMEKNTPLPQLPEQWHIAKNKTAGQLAYYLIDT